MLIINLLKVAVIWFTDLVNRLFDPFKLFVSYDAATNLEKLEQRFWDDLNARFYQPTGEFLYELPRPIDAGDTAIFQGLATAMKMLRGENTGRDRAFIRSLFVNGALIRGYWPDGRPNDTTSNDSATGLLFFFYVALYYGNPEERHMAGELICAWASHIRAHDWALCDLQGNPTKFGKLEQGAFLTDPLRITLLLGILAVARTYDTSFADDYRKLYGKYKQLLPYAKVSFLWWGKDYDTHRAAIHLHVLYKTMGDEVYRDGLRRTWRVSEKTQNPWVYALCASALEKRDDKIVKYRLSTFDFDRRQLGAVESLNPGAPTVKWPPIKLFGEEVKERSKYALPFWRRGSQEFFWQRNLFSKDEWVGIKQAQTYHSGLDYLLCYWLAKREGLI